MTIRIEQNYALIDHYRILTVSNGDKSIANHMVFNRFWQVLAVLNHCCIMAVD